MLVGVNTVTIKPGYGGLEEVFLRNVLGTIRPTQPNVGFVLFTTPQNDASFDGWDRVCLGPRGRSVLGRRAQRTSQLLEAAAQAGVDVLFSPLDAAPAKATVPVVLLITDLNYYETLANKGSWRGPGKIKAAKRICDNGVAIVAPSQYIQDVLLELLEVPLDKVVVASPGVDDVFGQPSPCFIQQPYLLTVGDTHKTRNIQYLRNALAQMRHEIPDHTLVVVGMPGDAEPAAWDERVMRVEQCANVHLASLYQHCSLYICASLYEGSGLTVLQAMRAGARVLSSRVGGIPEVAGDVPMYFNPESIRSLVRAIRRGLTEDGQQTRRRIQYGQQVAAAYTWEKCAAKTMSALRRVV